MQPKFTMDKDFIKFPHLSKNVYTSRQPVVFLENSKISTTDPLDKLNQELRDFYATIRLKSIENEMRDELVTAIKSYLSEYTIFTFGSHSTGLSLPTSDIDIAVEGEISKSNDILNKIKIKLEKCPLINSKTMFHLSKARVPILKFTDNLYNLKFDLSVNEGNVRKQTKYILTKLEETPSMKPFYILLKNFMKIRELTDVKRGGLCSYALFLMVVQFFQLHPLLQSSCVDPLENLGVLFLDFFQYFGYCAPGAKYSILKNAYFALKNGNVYGIEDPNDTTNDPALLCTNGHAIVDVFVHVYRIMTQIFKLKNNKDKSLLSVWMKINQAEELWRSRNIEKYVELKDKK